MRLDQVAELFKIIKRNYPSFDASVEHVKESLKYLEDFPFEAARENVDRHILTEKFPPTIAEIRGRLGDQIESQRSKEATASYFAQIELWKKNASPPPEGMRERIHALLRGDSA